MGIGEQFEFEPQTQPITFTTEEIKLGFEEIIKSQHPNITIEDYANGAGVVDFLIRELPTWKMNRKTSK